MNDEKDLTYQQAIEELRSILLSLQGELEDIDQLETLMKRAEILIRFCSAKIKDMETRLNDIINDIQQD